MSRRVRSATAGTAANTRPSTRLVMGMDRLAEKRDKQLQARERAVSAQAVRSAYRGVVCWLAKGIGDGLPEVTGRVVRRDIPVRSWEIVDEIYVLRVASS